MAETASSLKSGQVVKLTDGRSATIRYVGNPAFATGEWIGLELATGTGKNDGEVQGERYFECPPNYGMFVRPTAIKSIISDSDAGLSEAPLENGRRASTRPTSAVVSGLRRQSVMDRGTKRQSTDAPSPSGDRRSGLSRVSNADDQQHQGVNRADDPNSRPSSPRQNCRAPLYLNGQPYVQCRPQHDQGPAWHLTLRRAHHPRRQPAQPGCLSQNVLGLLGR